MIALDDKNPFFKHAEAQYCPVSAPFSAYSVANGNAAPDVFELGSDESPYV
jgi:hypothetical protein